MRGDLHGRKTPIRPPWALPESQLDRFLMRIHLGYPSTQAERQLLGGADRREMVHRLNACLTQDQIRSLQTQATQVHVSEAILDYVQALLQATRANSKFNHGLSPRAGLAIISSARAWAFMNNRDAVLPEDVQAIISAVVDHRLQSNSHDEYSESPGEHLIKSVAIP